MLPLPPRIWRCWHALRFVTTCRHSLGHARQSSTKSHRQYDALRVLFCGADQFSIHSLRGLHGLQQERAGTIASIDVVCRPDKRVGRGLKQVQEVPIKSVARDLGFTVHQIDTFRDWSLPNPFDLVITVSFGLLVPARVLAAASYGGLNVHPSLLPEFRGPAPIQHTLLNRKTHTGVTVQTMHPTKFDHGMILAQTPQPGLSVPDQCTPTSLAEVLGPLGSEMLCKAVKDGLFVPPLRDIGPSLPVRQASHAPKIHPEDRRINWNDMTAADVVLRDRVLGRLWDMTTYERCMDGREMRQPRKRVTFTGPWKRATGPPQLYDQCMNPGEPVVCDLDGNQVLGINAADRHVVVPAAATIEGGPKDQGLASLLHGLRTMLSTQLH